MNFFKIQFCRSAAPENKHMHMPFIIVSFTNPAGSSSVSEAETEVEGVLEEEEGVEDLDVLVLGRNWSSSSITKSSTALVLTME